MGGRREDIAICSSSPVGSIRLSETKQQQPDNLLSATLGKLPYYLLAIVLLLPPLEKLTQASVVWQLHSKVHATSC